MIHMQFKYFIVTKIKVNKNELIYNGIEIPTRNNFLREMRFLSFYIIYKILIKVHKCINTDANKCIQVPIKSPQMLVQLETVFPLFLQVYPLSKVQLMQPVLFPLSHSSLC